MDTSHVDFSDPIAVLRAFWIAAFDWNLRACQAHGEREEKRKAVGNDYNADQAFWATLNREWTEVLTAFCTPKKRVYSAGSSFGPSYYDPDNSRILSQTRENPRRIVVEVEVSDKGRGPAGGKYRYVLLKRGEKWLIDNKKVWRDYREKKWENHIL
jgi:hypothetical protein